MLRKLGFILISFFEYLSGKKVTYIPKDRFKKIETAVKSDLGFWYAGNVYNSSDIAYGIAYNGLIELEGTNLVKKILNFLLKNNIKVIFYDVGANTGYYGIMAAYLGKGKVFTYAFEPLKEFNLVEYDSISLNNLNSVCKVFNVALGNKHGKMQIILAGTGSSLNNEFLGQGKQDKQTRIVDLVVLDELQKKENLPSPNFIKIDVEGFEYNVLLGSVRIIKESCPIIWFESALTIKENKFVNNNFWMTQNLLKDLGYKVFLMLGESLYEVEEGMVIPDSTNMYLALNLKEHSEIFKLFKL